MKYILNDPNITYITYNEISVWWKSLSDKEKEHAAKLYRAQMDEADARSKERFGVIRPVTSIPDIIEWFDTFQPNTEGDKRAIVVAYANDIVVGVLWVNHYSNESDNEVAITALYVAREFRRKGIATELVTRGIALARVLVPNCIITLRVSAANEEALALYKKLGFTIPRSYILQLQ